GKSGVSQLITRRQPVVANFEGGGLLDHEQKIALETFNFTGLPEGVHPLSTVGVFDSEAQWGHLPEDERKRLEDRLRELEPTRRGKFIIVDLPKAQEPWPGYDDHSVEEILEFQKRLGVSPTVVRRYEEENKARPAV